MRTASFAAIGFVLSTVLLSVPASWLWRPPHTGVPEIVSRQSQPLRWSVFCKQIQN